MNEHRDLLSPHEKKYSTQRTFAEIPHSVFRPVRRTATHIHPHRRRMIKRMRSEVGVEATELATEKATREE